MKENDMTFQEFKELFDCRQFEPAENVEEQKYNIKFIKRAEKIKELVREFFTNITDDNYNYNEVIEQTTEDLEKILGLEDIRYNYKEQDEIFIRHMVWTEYLLFNFIAKIIKPNDIETDK
jgi:hypothetical protein